MFKRLTPLFLKLVPFCLVSTIAASLAADVTGGVNVDVVVNDAGDVTGALIVSSSKCDHLDSAALSAAMKTKFAPRHDTAYFPMRIYHLDYAFEDNLQ